MKTAAQLTEMAWTAYEAVCKTGDMDAMRVTYTVYRELLILKSSDFNKPRPALVDFNDPVFCCPVD